MSINSAFQPIGKTVTLQTNAAINTNTSALVKLSDFGLSQWPQAFRIVNNGTVDIWVSFTISGAGSNFPTPGTTTAGTPQPGFRLKPGIVEVFGSNVMNANPNNEQPPNPGFFVNNQASVANQTFDITPGEGL